MINPSLLLALALILGGCAGSHAPVNKILTLSPEARQAVLDLPVYNEGELTGKEHAVIESVKGISCRYRKGDPSATETDAINEAKYWAKNQGAEAIKNLKCTPPLRKSLFNRCWESITCTGKAIKFSE